ncbi:hypothetical protein BDZ45DRAFT_88683 [Acephala macrosclerotiorum]|nr:hypothetical protein BDZ45DRAFT_88683 [Acephala macrosclerotiorum]
MSIFVNPSGACSHPRVTREKVPRHGKNHGSRLSFCFLLFMGLFLICDIVSRS